MTPTSNGSDAERDSSSGVPLPTDLHLARLPLPWRGLLTCVLIFLGAGYFAAQINVLAQNELTDGEPGLSARDLILKYHGGEVEVRAGEAAPSRMLEMIQTAMRQYFTEDAHFTVLHDWLKAGAPRDRFSSGADLTPELVLALDCMRCHAADSGKEIGTLSPFGPDLFTVEYDRVAELALAHEHDHENGAATVWRPPRDWRALAMSTHAHLLAVPMFVGLLGALFLLSHWPAATGLRTVLACAPLVFFLLDVAFWWLARLDGIGPAFALGIGATGALFGLTFLFQWVVVMIALWRPASGAPPHRAG